MAAYLALLRGINVSGTRKIPMADLRELAEGLGLGDVKTYIQSGNLVFTASQPAAALEAQLERAIHDRFGFAVDVLVRSAAQWPAYLRANPFPDAARDQPNLLMLALSKQPLRSEAVATLRQRAQNGERIEAAGEVLWVHYPSGVAASKLSPALFDRAAGSPVTARNFRTAQKLAEMLAAAG